MLGFRVWCTQNGGSFISDLNSYCIKSDGKLYLMLTQALEVYPKPLNETFIPMQSTGLRCQKIIGGGDFIYEKDVVSITIPDTNEEYVVIVASIPFFYSKLPGNDVKFIIEIMGNLFENPELYVIGATC